MSSLQERVRFDKLCALRVRHRRLCLVGRMDNIIFLLNIDFILFTFNTNYISHSRFSSLSRSSIMASTLAAASLSASLAVSFFAGEE